MARYTEDFLAAARQGYENTDQPMRELARELGIGITTLSTLAEKHGWAKRSLRKRGVPPAMQLLAEVKELAQQAPPTPTPSPPLAALAEGGEQSVSAALVVPEPPNLLSKLEQILAQLIASQQLAPANGIHSQQGARNLTLLIQAMRALKGMRGADAPDTGPIEDNDDDMPRDIDEFRRDLARRIDAFVASRTDAGDVDGNARPAPLDAAG